MFSKFWLVNILLAAGVVFFAVKTHEVWKHRDMPAETAAPPANEEKAGERRFAKRNLPSESSYKTLVDKNLFADDRSEYLPPEPEPEPEPEPVAAVEEEKGPDSEPQPEIKPFEGFGKKVTLYGVVLFSDYKKALISNPDRGRDAPKDVWVAKGDVVMEMKQRDQTTIVRVEDILEDRILVEDGTSRYELMLYDKDNPKKRPVIPKNTEPKVVSPKKGPKKATAGKAARPKRKKTPRRAAKAVDEKNSGDSKYEVINTPFGEIKRRKK